ncbi:restriction endonuclease [Williamsia sp. SKLECPSW1]
MSDLKPGAVANYAGQLWALRARISAGDVMVLPMKTTKQIAIGRVKSPYRYLGQEVDPSLRHVVEVEWQRTDLPRTAIKQDLLFTLGSALTIFAPTKNYAVERLERVLDDGVDPGQAYFLGLSSHESSAVALADDAVDEPESSPDIEYVAQLQISAKLAEEFAGHDLATLVTALLRLDGFDCRQAPPGPDGGVDINAGRGLLGLDDPLLIVQVKSGGQVNAPVVQQLHGAMAQQGATQGLLVAWGGLTKPAWNQVHASPMRVRVWEAQDVVDAVLARYDALPEEIRAKAPLKRVWMLSTE